jgi:hypothetical protein
MKKRLKIIHENEEPNRTALRGDPRGGGMPDTASARGKTQPRAATLVNRLSGPDAGSGQLISAGQIKGSANPRSEACWRGLSTIVKTRANVAFLEDFAFSRAEPPAPDVGAAQANHAGFKPFAHIRIATSYVNCRFCVHSFRHG